MTERIEDVYSGLAALLPTDTGLDSWADTHFSRDITVVNGNTPVEKLDANKLPAAILEIGDTDSEPQVHGQKQLVAHDIPFAIAWVENDVATAFSQRLQLHDLMVKALMTSGTLGVPGAGVFIAEVQSDRNIFHPRHVMRFVARVDFTVNKP